VDYCIRYTHYIIISIINKTKMSELRMYLAEKILSWAFYIAPNNKEGKFLKLYVGGYAVSVMEKLKNKK